MSSITCQPTYNYHICSGLQNQSNYISNLDSALNSLSSKASTNNFFNDTSNGIYSLFLCRGDVSTDTCQTCVKNASLTIRQLCPSNKTAIIWYDECMLRYSDTDFFGLTQMLPWLLMWNAKNTTSLDQKNYDINSSLCKSCLEELTAQIKKCCQSQRGWRILSPSCNLTYEEYRFYQQPPAPPPPPVPAVPQLTPIDKGEGITEEILLPNLEAQSTQNLMQEFMLKMKNIPERCFASV
ncbi:hypothetical protein EZV62_026493 [Acer yangbiense]|uniref:Gnk2-homologous domain-containing protein n=1 Tax=Acer yangbiense TaxID=1000413 RepID=A0A5C7GRQ8_9ROSI|nr:hypothetical protein EZV62_026493 [Acer yangbiense]